MKFNFKIDSGFTNISYTKIGSSNDYVTSERRIVSYFITENKIIVCFYYSKTANKYSIILLSTNLVQIKEENILDNINDSKCFYKCIHFKKEIGIFVYYVGNEQESLKIKIIEIKENNSIYSINNYITDFLCLL